jgi:hypothetical protein
MMQTKLNASSRVSPVRLPNSSRNTVQPILPIVLGAAAWGLYSYGWGTTALAVGSAAAYSGYRWGRYLYGRYTNPAEPIETTYQISLLYTQRYTVARGFADDHTTIGLIENGQLQEAWGFWVNGDEYNPIYIGKGIVRNDIKKYKGDVKKHKLFNVSKEQYDRVKKLIDKERVSPPKFDANHIVGYSCTTWAHHILRDGAGITVENRNLVLRAYPEDLQDRMTDIDQSYFDNRKDAQEKKNNN